MKAIQLNRRFLKRTLEIGKSNKNEEEYCHYAKYNAKNEKDYCHYTKYNAKNEETIRSAIKIITVILLTGIIFSLLANIILIAAFLCKFLNLLIYFVQFEFFLDWIDFFR